MALKGGREDSVPVEDSTIDRWKRWAERTVREAATFLARVWAATSHPPDQMPALTDPYGRPKLNLLPYMAAWGLEARRRSWNEGCLCCVYLSMALPQNGGHDMPD